MIGCEREKKMLRLIAKYGDACNLHLGTPLKEYSLWMRESYQKREEDLTRKLDKSKMYCNKSRRSYDDIERTVLGTIKLAPEAMNPTQVARAARIYGTYDIMAKVKADSMDKLKDIIIDVHHLGKVQSTQSMVVVGEKE